jgi:hypothetical protein
VRTLRIEKQEFYSNYADDPPALVFIDAIHTYSETKKDIVWAKSVGTEVICGHDYSENHPGVIKVVEEFGGYKKLVETAYLL